MQTEPTITARQRQELLERKRVTTEAAITRLENDLAGAAELAHSGDDPASHHRVVELQADLDAERAKLGQIRAALANVASAVRAEDAAAARRARDAHAGAVAEHRERVRQLIVSMDRAFSTASAAAAEVFKAGIEFGLVHGTSEARRVFGAAPFRERLIAAIYNRFQLPFPGATPSGVTGKVPVLDLLLLDKSIHRAEPRIWCSMLEEVDRVLATLPEPVAPSVDGEAA